MKILYHHGIKGQRKGIRRYQNYDGSLTEEGKLRYRELIEYKENSSKSINNYYDRKIEKRNDEVNKKYYNALRELELKKLNDIDIDRYADYKYKIDDALAKHGEEGLAAVKGYLRRNHMDLSYHVNSKDRKKAWKNAQSGVNK